MFAVYQSLGGDTIPWIQLPANAGTYKAGQILEVASGKLKALSGALTTTPTYICQEAVTAGEGQLVHVMRVVPYDVVYETQVAKTSAGVKTGQLMQVNQTGLGVDSTAPGAFEVIDIESTAGTVGETVHGRFVVKEA